MPSPAVTLTGTLHDTSGTGIPGKVVLTLVNYGPALPRVTGTSIIANQQYTAQAAANGTFSVTFWGNYQLLETGSYYEITVYGVDAAGGVSSAANITDNYQFNVPGSFDLSAINPIASVPISLPPSTILLTNNTWTGNNAFSSASFGGNAAFTGTETFSGPATFASLNSVLYIGSATGQYTGLQAAHDALPSTGGTIVITPGYTVTETSTINITKNNVSIVGQGQFYFGSTTGETTIVFNHTGVGINVTGQNFGMNALRLQIGTTSTRVGVPIIDSNTIAGGQLSNLLIIGQNSSPNNGIFFRSTDAVVRQGVWQLSNIFNRDGATWTSIITVSIASSSLTGAYYQFQNIVDSDSEKYTDAAIVLDGLIDTVLVQGSSVGNALVAGGPAIWVRNTVSAPNSAVPRWVHFDNCFVESNGTGTGLQIDSGRDINYWGYIANCLHGVNVTGSFDGVNIHDTVFTTMNDTAIVITGGLGINAHHNTFQACQKGVISYTGGGGVVIDGNTFYDTGLLTTNTYDTVSLASGTAIANITNNNFVGNGANKARYGINCVGTFSDLVVAGNNYAAATFGTGFLHVPSGGNNWQILGQESSVTNILQGPLTANSAALLSAGVLSWNADTGISRDSAAVIDIGNGTATNKSGRINLATLSATTAIQLVGSVGTVSFDASGANLLFNRAGSNNIQANAVGGILNFFVNGNGSASLRMDAAGNVGVWTLGNSKIFEVGAGVTLYATDPTTAAGQVGLGATTGFGAGSAGTAVTTTTKGAGSGPTTPQTITKYLEVDVAGTKFWIPLVQ